MKGLSFLLKRKDANHQKSKRGGLMLNFHSLECLNHSSVTFGMFHLQRQYMKARRNIKERLAVKGNKEPQKQRINEMGQEEQEDEYINAFDFLINF